MLFQCQSSKREQFAADAASVTARSLRSLALSPPPQPSTTTIAFLPAKPYIGASGKSGSNPKSTLGLGVHLSLLILSLLSTSLALASALCLPIPPSIALPGPVLPNNILAAGLNSAALGVPVRNVFTRFSSPSRAERDRLALLAIRCARTSRREVSVMWKGPPPEEREERERATGVDSIVPQVMRSCRDWGSMVEARGVGRAETKEKPRTLGVPEVGLGSARVRSSLAGVRGEGKGERRRCRGSERTRRSSDRGVDATSTWTRRSRIPLLDLLQSRRMVPNRLKFAER